mmetsp:Transcript_34711/g.54147  ORF Transcript_34711/g.54147 Transcript_34711/m.54147 type:complete len:364 (-) Transcript_34711:44-1135(-)|eukprot:CAMPEP_0201514922 /NCGR_PEP_ID=MMETSP0161_2-20130828/6632_1 /ASSEMBLY_ACC=CAM_ASM_000251 /TAXON_ID=180227 /ORGANISM="Neoparamoeba aestuarina, Strain SoJaBio B1-5/56/2" /LENGTH=363 /DNA_ID=CAMNT_0047911611 /DNA_START=98 /DNA_END=1189 /DNA_ORIENTATION=+
MAKKMTHFHNCTPLIESDHIGHKPLLDFSCAPLFAASPACPPELSKVGEGDGEFIPFRCFLKLDLLQPTGSFKIRGVGNRCLMAHEEGAECLVSSSGGNAGVAAAYCGKKMGKKVYVIVPKSTPELGKQLIAEQGAEVIVHGEVWDDANKYAHELAKEKNAAYVSPFDHHQIWTGNSSMVPEIKEQLDQHGIEGPPDAFVVVVGGGGLLCGLVEGLQKLGGEWAKVPIVAVETVGADSLYQATTAGELVTLPDITSIAKTLGARRVAEQCMINGERHPYVNVAIPDSMALDGCETLLNKHKMLVEPSSGAGAAVLMSSCPMFMNVLKNRKSKRDVPVVVGVVCGGSAMDSTSIQRYREQISKS